MIILFSGIPGCGKTTIAACVAQRLQEIGTVQLINSGKLRPPVYKKIFKPSSRVRNAPSLSFSMRRSRSASSVNTSKLWRGASRL